MLITGVSASASRTFRDLSAPSSAACLLLICSCSLALSVDKFFAASETYGWSNVNGRVIALKLRIIVCQTTVVVCAESVTTKPYCILCYALDHEII